ncbi:hybrid sensor histidine kinase/response regulator [Limnobacter parvus]|uniref:histidine kinase n=1 Tax=Limnobacter parvus TaxID=2939690 RepID=A0ABT1XD46_9BURK|nr:hybrid sensor histidine kinase/response regulator [Limnobacter parvus]MCR2745196.1 hybrid sensor histidine kinase/response regulator [Limnobacter parvus]
MKANNTHLHLILREQTKLLFEHLPFVLYGVMAASAGLVAVLWQTSQDATLLLWLLAVYLLTGLRWLGRRRFLQQGHHFDPKYWIKTAIAFTAASGVLWGIAGVLFFSTEPLVLITLTIFLAAMVAGAVSSHSCHTPAFAAFALPASLPFIARCIAEASTFYVVLGTVSLVYVLINIHYGRNLQNMVIQSIRLRFQNAELVEELTMQKRVAEQASAAKTRFLAAASHDLRQPVQAIELLIDALGTDLANHPSKGLLNRIQEAGHGLRNLLNTLLDSAKVNSAAITAKPRHIQLEPLLRRVCQELAPQARLKNLDIRVASTKACGYSDPALLELILRNYIENAIKYSHKGRILVGCRRLGEFIRIEVHDMGIGIPTSAQETVFQEYYQLGNPERDKAKGLGLGLYIADSLSRLLNHDLGVRSTVGKGSMFYVTVPLGKSSHLIDVPHHAPANLTPLRGKTVLVIDDDDMVRASVSEMLSRWECNTVAAENAEAALRILVAQGKMPDAIVADYRLQTKCNGMQAIQSLRSQLGNVPAVILTGDTGASRVQEANQSGFKLLHKPLSGVQLREALSELIGQASA